MQPSNEFTGSELWEALQKPVYFELVNFYIGNEDMDNRKIFPIRMEVLSANTIDTCKKQAHAYLLGLKKDLELEYTEDLWTDRHIREVLFRAARNPKTKFSGDREISFPAFPSVEAVGELPIEAVAQLFKLYLQTQMKFGHHDRLIRSKADLDAFIAKLVEGGNRDPLQLQDSHHLEEILIALALEYYAQILKPKSVNSSDSNITNLAQGIGYFTEPPAESTGDLIQPNPPPGLINRAEAIESVKKSYSDPKPSTLNTPEQAKELAAKLDPKKKK